MIDILSFSFQNLSVTLPEEYSIKDVTAYQLLVCVDGIVVNT
jgi:hypothetical protein